MGNSAIAVVCILFLTFTLVIVIDSLSGPTYTQRVAQCQKRGGVYVNIVTDTGRSLCIDPKVLKE